MDIKIREIQEIDYPEILSLYNFELVNHNVNAINIVADYERMSKDDNYKTFVALMENNVVGFITTVQVLSVGLPVGYLKINGLAVKEEHQNKGIGKKLLQYVENIAYEKRISYILLNSGVKRINAHAFYERNDYDKDSYCFDKVLKYSE
jgi:predicted N-acetyltransferase YhbS